MIFEIFQTRKKNQLKTKGFMKQKQMLTISKILNFYISLKIGKNRFKLFNTFVLPILVKIKNFNKYEKFLEISSFSILDHQLKK